MINEHGKGLLPSPIDKRDVVLSSVMPSVVRIPEECPPPFDLDVLDQNGYPYCVGFSCATIKQEKELREKVYEVFDGSWVYKKCKEIDDIPEYQGTYLRAGMKVLQKQGCKPLNGPEESASRFKIGGYALVDDRTLQGLKKAIFVNGALLAGFTGSDLAWKTAYPRPPKDSEPKWKHAVSLIGYTKTHIIGQNSWGKNWGNNGLFYVDENCLTSMFEVWAVLTDLPTEQLELENSGWVAINYLDIFNPAVSSEALTTAKLNFRDKPNGKILLTLPKGKKVKILGGPIKAGNYNWVRIKEI